MSNINSGPVSLVKLTEWERDLLAMADSGQVPAIKADESVTARGPESLGTIWVCVCCMLTHANGECCAEDTHGGDSCEPLSAIEAPHTVAMGMAFEEHSEDCETRIQGRVPDNYECDCERNTYSTSQCEGCGSYLHGERHAMTLFAG